MVARVSGQDQWALWPRNRDDYLRFGRVPIWIILQQVSRSVGATIGDNQWRQAAASHIGRGR